MPELPPESGLDHIVRSMSRVGSLNHLLNTPEVTKTEVRYRLPILGSKVLLLTRFTDKGYLVGASGLTTQAKRWLNQLMVTDARLVVDAKGMEIHACALVETPEQAALAMERFGLLIMETRETEEHGSYFESTTVNTYWSAGVINFGDWLGPHVIRRLSGKRPVYLDRPGHPTRGLFSVGSVLDKAKRNNADIWGTGLIKPLNDAEITERKKLKGVKVHAVRGKKTQQQLVDGLGWEVPDVYGDPALLLPFVYSPSTQEPGRVAFTPHGVHHKYLGELPTDVDFIHVRRDFRNVVDGIANARAVVSTSLHGLIIAQAYGVPWIRLKVEDHPLWGADFKFQDFYSTLDDEAVQTHQITSSELSDLDIPGLAERAVLPELKIDLNELKSRLPVKPLERHRFSQTGSQLDYMPGIRDLDGNM